MSVSATAAPVQCVTFARAFSGIDLHGNAATWWGQANGKYEQGSAPRVGGVLVFKATGAMRVGHVATVSAIVSSREIRVTHANWSPVDGHRGQVETDVAVVDTSAAGDWSQVRVWYGPIGDLGRRDYPVYGFIYGDHAPAGVTAPATAFAVAAVDAMPIQLAGL
nr:MULTISPECIES: CHAP domain-containing protein [Polymorphobacter]